MAEQTPLSALRIGELALEAGVPPGVLNIIQGAGGVTGAALSKHRGVDKASLAGQLYCYSLLTGMSYAVGEGCFDRFKNCVYMLYLYIYSCEGKYFSTFAG